MQRFLHLFIVFFSLTFFVSCTPDEELIPIQIDSNGSVSTMMDFRFKPTGETFLIAFTSDVPWQIQNKPDWLSVSKMVGKRGTTNVRLTAGLNQSRHDYNDTIRFVADNGSYSLAYVISQECPYVRLKTDSMLQFDWNSCIAASSEPIRIDVEANVDWHLMSGADTVLLRQFGLENFYAFGDTSFYVLPNKYNLGRDTIRFGISLQPLMYSRDSVLVDIPISSSVPVRIDISQSNLRFIINDNTQDTTEVVLSETNDTIISLSIDAEIPWIIAEHDWVVLNTTQTNEGKVELVTCRADGANPTRMDRECIIRVNAKKVEGASRFLRVLQPGYTFDVNGDNLLFESEDDVTQYINVQTKGTWMVTDIPDWMMVNPLKGEGDQIISVNVKPNYVLEDRSGNLQVKSLMNMLQEPVRVLQQRYRFEIDKNSLNFGAYHPSGQSVQLSCLSDWTAVATDGFSVTPSGVGDAMLSVSAEDNYSMNSKVGTIKIRSHGNEILLSLSQSPYRFSAPTTKLDFTAYQSNSRSVALTCLGNWTAVATEGFSVTPSGVGNSTLIVSADDNYSMATKDGSVTITSHGNTIQIPLSQSAYQFSAPTTKLNFTPYRSGSQTIALTCSGDWTARVTAGFSLPISAGSGNNTLIVTATDNYNFTPREGIVTITSHGHEIQIPLSQSAYQFSAPSTQLNFTPYKSATKTIELICSGDWTAVATNGFSVTPSGAGNKIPSVTADDNYAMTPKEGSVTITSHGHTATINLSQDAYVFSAVTTPLSFSAINATAQTIALTCSGDWTAVATNGFSVTPSGVGNATLSVIASDNQSLTSKKGSVTITSHGHTATINLSQDAYVFSAVTTPLSFSAINATAQTIALTCSGDWTAVATNGFSVTPSGVGNATLSVIASDNQSLTSKKGSVTITSHGHTATINLSQDAYVLTLSPTTLDVDSNGGNQSVSVVSTGAWQASSNASWISITTLNAPAGNSTLRFFVESLPEDQSSRIGTIDVNADGITKSITVTQSINQQ